MIKIEHFPYLVIDSAWGSTLNIFNSGFNTEKVKVSFRRDQKKEEVNISINPNARFVFSESDINTILGASNNPFSISVMSNESTTMLCGMYMKDSSGIKFFNIMPSNCMDEKPSCLYCSNGIDFDMSRNNYLYKFYGNTSGKYLEYKTGCLFDYILSKDAIKNLPNLVVGDCCRNDGLALEGHPEGSHSGILNYGGKSADINYPRYDGGYTEYRPVGAAVSPIFSADGNLLVNFFDHKRFYEIICDIDIYFPDSVVRVDQRIKTFLESTYGTLSFVQGDAPNAYSHNMHSHIDFGSKINI